MTLRPRASAHPPVTIYWRHQGGVRRAYGDFRRWGGGREALTAPGAKLATSNPAAAEQLAAARRDLLIEQRAAEERSAAQAARLAATLGLDASATLYDFAAHHLLEEGQAGERSRAWIDACALMLERAVGYFDGVQVESATVEQRRKRPGLTSPRNMATISTVDCDHFAKWLATDDFWEWEIRRRETAAAAGERMPVGGQRGAFGPQHVRHHVTALSGMFKRAVAEGVLAVNPCREMMAKPSIPPSTTEWLEAPELALAIEAARTYDPVRLHGGREPLSCVYELVAFLILTGCRMDEARLMEWRHVHFHAHAVEIPGTKTDESDRVVPLHAQLAEILGAYRKRTGAIAGPLFPSERGGGAFGDARKALNAVADRAGIPRKMLRSRPLRASYATNRLLSLDEGREVTPEAVRQELGHSKRSGVLEDRYVKKLRLRRWRLDPFAFRIETYADEPGVAARLERMRKTDAALPEPHAAQAADSDVAERARIIREFLEATQGLSNRAVQAETQIAYRAVGRLRTGQQADAYGATLGRMREYLRRHTRDMPAGMLAAQ